MSDIVIVSRHRAGIEFIARHLAGDITPGVPREYRVDLPSNFGKPGGSTRGEVRVLRIMDAQAGEVAIATSGAEDTEVETYPVLAEVGASDVLHRRVYGNLPLHLAALCQQVVALEFAGAPPRGQEYGLPEMDAAGARLMPYVVRQAGYGPARTPTNKSS